MLYYIVLFVEWLECRKNCETFIVYMGMIYWVHGCLFSETHKGIETCSTVPCSEIFKANLHILSTIFGYLKLNSKWPLCYKTNLSWNIANFIEALEEVLSSYDYYMLCNYPVSFLEHKKGWFIREKYFKRKSEYSVACNQRNVWWLHVSSKLWVSAFLQSYNKWYAVICRF